MTTDFLLMKKEKRKIAALTSYDASFTKLISTANCDTVLVGDSLGMVIKGDKTTHNVTIGDIIYHIMCVRNGDANLHIMADLPIGTFESSPNEALASAIMVIAAGANMVKIEGGQEMAETIRTLVENNIPVCGHVGLLPQSTDPAGFKVKGKDQDEASIILNDAKAVSEAGATLMVLEMIPAKLAGEITKEVSAATIGIGAGRDCDGQILVLYDVIGVYPKPPKFSKNFLMNNVSIQDALIDYVESVKNSSFPEDANIPA